MRISFNEAIQATTPLLATLTVLVAGTARTISSYSVNTTNRQLLLNLSTFEAAPTSDQTVRVKYVDQPGDQSSDAIQDLVGNDLEGFALDADSLRSAVSVPATPALAGAYTTVVLTGSSALNGVGNAGNNSITGNSGANRLEGGLGDDDLQGAAGNDTLLGGLGHDSLRGGTGLDQLTGGTGNDLFDFGGSNDGLIGGSRDKPLFERITDLQIGQASGNDSINTMATGPRGVRVLGVKPTALTRTAITTLLNGSSNGIANFAASTACVFTHGSGSSLRSFLAINDGTAGYDSSRDQLLEITGYTGVLSDLVVL